MKTETFTIETFIASLQAPAKNETLEWNWYDK